MRWLKVLAASLALGLGTATLSACTQLSAIVPGTSINLGLSAFPNSWNADLPQDDEAVQLANSQLGYLTQPLLSDFDASGELVSNESVISSSVLVDSRSGKTPTETESAPLVTGDFVVEYRLKPGISWSDGVAIDAADLLLAWLAAADPLESGFESVRSEGSLRFSKWAAVDSESGSLQVAFSQPVPDYQSVLALAVPAHVTVQLAFPDEALTAEQAKQKLIAAVAEAQGKVLRKLALEYRQGYRLDDQQAPAQLAARVVGGAYAPVTISGDSIGLLARADFQAGRLPQIESVNLIFAADPEAALALVEAGELDIVAPEPSLTLSVAQIASRLSAAESVRGGVQPTENVLMVLVNSGERSNLADAAFESPTQAALVRDAVSRLIPTSEILSFKSAEIAVVQSRSLVFDATATDYEGITAANGSEGFRYQDLEAAAELLEQSGAVLPIRVRVLFESANPDAQAVWALLSQRASEVGIQLLNQGTERFRGGYKRGGYELAILERPLLTARDGSGVTELAADLERQGRASLLGQLDGIIAAVDDRQERLIALDKALFGERYGIPLYQYSTLYAISNRVTGYQAPPDGRGVVWGYWNWSVPAANPSADPGSQALN